MKKYISIIIAAMLAFSSLTACGNKNNSDFADAKKLQVVTTIFPTYDWIREIMGDELENAELTMLLDSGVDLHSYQPTAEDILKISACDVFIYVGGGSDAWVDAALKEAVNKDMVTVDLCGVLGDVTKQEEQVEGMENSHAKEHAGDTGADGKDYHHTDEHVWLSLKNAKILCSAIAEALCSADSEHQDTYTANAKSYNEKIEALDLQYQAAVDGGQKSTLLFGDRFPFRYMTDDYGLNYYAAFTGCSAESEASFETITFLAGKVDELDLDTVLTIEKSNQKIAKTIIENTKAKNQKILEMNSMQSVTAKDIADGVSYLSIMENNLGVLKNALQ